jgi:hypothetical protein
MTFSSGFEIEKPKVHVRWGISERVLVDLFGAYNLRKVTVGHYDISCVSLGGLHHELSSEAPRLLLPGEIEFTLDCQKTAC